MELNNLKIEKVAIDTIFEDPNNARLHPKENLDTIKASLKRFGMRKPIVVSEQDNIIIAGNGTYRAAVGLGWKEIWVAWSPLSFEEAMAYAISDNQSSLLAEWDVEILASSVKQLNDWNPHQDWESIGFTSDDVKGLTGHSPDNSSPELTVEPLPETGNLSNDDDIPDLAEPIRVTGEQRETIDFAIKVLRESEADPAMSEGRCLELLAADFISGMKGSLVESGHLEEGD